LSAPERRQPRAAPDLDRAVDPAGVALAGTVRVELVELDLHRRVELQVLLVEAPRVPGRALGPAQDVLGARSPARATAVGEFPSTTSFMAWS